MLAISHIRSKYRATTPDPKHDRGNQATQSTEKEEEEVEEKSAYVVASSSACCDNMQRGPHSVSYGPRAD